MEISLRGGQRYEDSYQKVLRDNKKILEKILEGQRKYHDSLGWLNPIKWANEELLEEIKDIAKEIKENADVFILIGVGGSNNTARAMIKALGEDTGVEIIYAGNNLSAYELNKILKRIENKSIYINCIAKNFETLEPGIGFRIFREFLKNKYKEVYNKRIITIGTKGSLLEKISNTERYRFLEFPNDVGGRYTAFTSVSLLAMAVAGLDINSFVEGAVSMSKELYNFEIDNIAYRYACLRNTYYKNSYRLELLTSFETRFEYFYKWWIQLFAESEGKDNKGLFPIAALYSEELHSLGQFVQEGNPIIFETFLSVKNDENTYIIPQSSIDDKFSYIENKALKDINEKVFRATIEAHSNRLPCILFEIEHFDEYNLGALMYFFMFSCYISGEIFGINPFDQRGVEEYKKCAFKSLGKV